MKAKSILPIRICFFIVCFTISHFSFAFEIQCPADVTLDCNEYIYDLSQYGNAQYKDYNGWHDAGDPVVTYDLNHCDQGTITRTWSAVNPYNDQVYYCSQTIYIGGSYFNESNITWPQTGLEISGCNPDLSPYNLPAGYQQPTWSAGTCALIGSSYSDKVFYFSGACKKIVRTWELINCCDFNVYTGEGIYTFNQEIDVTISDVPQVECPSDVSMESFDCNGAYVEVPGIIIPDSECSDVVTIMNDSPYSTSGSDASGNYPIGTTLITFTADYGCWQKTMCQVEVTVIDATAPTPYCIYGLSIALMGIDADNDGQNENGMVEVWASDLDKGSFASCNSNSPLTFSFSSNVNDQVREFTCDDVGRNDVEIWVTDEYGRQNYCTTYIRVQNNGANIPDCEDSDDYSLIAGTIQAHYGGNTGLIELKAIATGHEGEDIVYETMEYTETVIDSFYNNSGTLIYIIDMDSVLVEVTETIYPTLEHFESTNSTEYMFEDMLHYNDYTIHASVNDPTRARINIADIAEIEGYINGINEFTAYQKLAADANQDGLIDFQDVQLLKDVVNNVNGTTLDDRWHFFDAFMDMENMDDDHECEEFCRVMDLKDNTYKVNLVGYRPGDVTKDVILEESLVESILMGSTILGRENEIENEEKIVSFSVSPNPFTNILNIELNSSKTEQTNFVMRDQFGSIVMSKAIVLKKGNNNIQIDILNDLPSGVYLYDILIGENNMNGKLIHVQ